MSKYMASISVVLVSHLISVSRANAQEIGSSAQPETALPQFEVASIKLNP